MIETENGTENTHNQLLDIVFIISKGIPRVDYECLGPLLYTIAYLFHLSMWDEVSPSLLNILFHN